MASIICMANCICLNKGANNSVCRRPNMVWFPCYIFAALYNPTPESLSQRKSGHVEKPNIRDQTHQTLIYMFRHAHVGLFRGRTEQIYNRPQQLKEKNVTEIDFTKIPLESRRRWQNSCPGKTWHWMNDCGVRTRVNYSISNWLGEQSVLRWRK